VSTEQDGLSVSRQEVAGESPAGYTIVLPPGWERIPLRGGTNQTIKTILDDRFRSLPDKLPRDKLIQYRVEVEGRLRKTATQARNQGGIDLYLPVDFQHGGPLAASFIVSQGSLGTTEPLDPAHLVTYLASESSADSAVTVDHAVGLRREQTAPPDPSQDLDYGSRRVDYIVAVPGQQDRWLFVTFSTLGGGDPDDRYAKAMVQLFDAIMSTFRWTRS
jgi:hypothetical protein